MPAALACTLEVAKRAARQQSGEIKLLIFTDGRANVPLRRNFVGSSEEKRSIIKTELEYLGLELRRAGVAITVVGSEDRLARTGDTFRLAELLKAELVQITRAQPAKQARSIKPGA
jgi:Mg-chelatase subunit ChlD